MVVYRIDRWCTVAPRKGTVIENLEKQYRVTDERGREVRWAKKLCFIDPESASIALIAMAEECADDRKKAWDAALADVETAKAWIKKEKEQAQ